MAHIPATQTGERDKDQAGRGRRGSDDADHILDVYKNASYHKISGGNGQYPGVQFVDGVRQEAA